MPKSPRKVVVIHPGGLGDVLLSSNALAAIRAGFPQQELILCAGPDVGHLLVHCGVVDHTLPIESDRVRALFSGKSGMSASRQEFFRQCDLFVGWLSDHDGSLRHSLQAFGIPRLILQSPAEAEGRHQSDRFLQTLKAEIVVENKASLSLRLPEYVRQAGVSALHSAGVSLTVPMIICHPGSGSVHKCVKVDRWNAIIRGCLDRQLLPVIVLGPADEQVAVAIRQAGLPDLPMIHPQSATVLAAILAQAQGYIGHDSGVTHLAALLEVPTVAMFGPTDPQRWAPRGAHVAVVKGDYCKCSGWDAVRACGEKSCLNVNQDEVFGALDATDFRYHRVTNS